MAKLPTDFPQLACGLFYARPLEAIAWLERAFGFQLRVKVVGDDGALVHSELEYGAGVILVNTAHGVVPNDSTYVMLYVEDIDAHHARAVAAGARVTRALSTAPYGDRGYGVTDPEGHSWWFAQRVDQPAYDAAITSARVS